MGKQDSTETADRHSKESDRKHLPSQSSAPPITERSTWDRDPDGVQVLGDQDDDVKIGTDKSEIAPWLDVEPSLDTSWTQEDFETSIQAYLLSYGGGSDSTAVEEAIKKSAGDFAGLHDCSNIPPNFPIAEAIPADPSKLAHCHKIPLDRHGLRGKRALQNRIVKMRKSRRRQIDYSEVKPDAAKLSFWNVGQAIVWLMYQDVDRVRAMFNQDADEATVIGTAMEPILEEKRTWLDGLERSEQDAAVRQIELEVRARYREAIETIESYAKSGSLVIFGRKNGDGDFVEIPQVEWTMLTLETYATQIGATAYVYDGGWPCFLDLKVERDVLMRLSLGKNKELPLPSSLEKAQGDPDQHEIPPTGYDDTASLDEMARLLNAGEARSRNAASEIVAPSARPKSTSVESKAKRLREKFKKTYNFRNRAWEERSS